MNNLNEIKNFIKTIDPGEPIYKINLYSTNSSVMMLHLDPWDKKRELLADKTSWLNLSISESLQRHFNADNGTIEVSVDKTMEYLKIAIIDQIMPMFNRTSPAKKVKQTNAYKNMIKIVSRNATNEDFIDMVLPIINFYHDTKPGSMYYISEEVHHRNVFALLEILRKKYETKSDV